MSRVKAAYVSHDMAIAVMMHAALPVDGIVLQTAKHARAIDLRCQVISPGRWTSSTAVNGSLLAASNDMQHIGNQIFLVEMRQRRKNPGTVAQRGQKCWIELRLDAVIFHRLLF